MSEYNTYYTTEATMDTTEATMDTIDTEATMDTNDIIDIRVFDEDMCYKIWKDFKEQYRPFTLSLIKLTNISTHLYFANSNNRIILLNYINRRLKGIQIVKIKPIGSCYFFVVVKRILEDTLNNKIEDLQSQIRLLKTTVHDLELKFVKLYYAPGMPGYIEASREFRTISQSYNSSDSDSASRLK